MVKIAIGGSREYADYDEFRLKIDEFLKDYNKKKLTIISGGARGTDSLAERYARENGINLKIHYANWEMYGRAAGPIRNEIMVKEADIVIAFFNGKSKGTKSLIELAKKHEKPLFIKKIKS